MVIIEIVTATDQVHIRGPGPSPRWRWVIQHHRRRHPGVVPVTAPPDGYTRTWGNLGWYPVGWHPTQQAIARCGWSELELPR